MPEQQGYAFDERSMQRIASMLVRFERLFPWIESSRENPIRDRYSSGDVPSPMFGYLKDDVTGVTNPEASAAMVNVQMLEVDTLAANRSTTASTLRNRADGGPANDGIMPAVYRFDSDLPEGTLVKLEELYGQWHVTAAGCDPLDPSITDS